MIKIEFQLLLTLLLNKLGCHRQPSYIYRVELIIKFMSHPANTSLFEWWVEHYMILGYTEDEAVRLTEEKLN